jgi:HEAT repeat protein
VDVIGGTANESQRRGPTILRALSDASAPARRAAARQAANIIDPSALPRLVDLLHDADMTVRLTAATTIGRFGGLAKTYLPQLQEALAREPDGTTQHVIEGAIKTISR